MPKCCGEGHVFDVDKHNCVNGSDADADDNLDKEPILRIRFGRNLRRKLKFTRVTFYWPLAP
jgi:hypothetical protein